MFESGLSPELVIIVNDKHLGLLGYLVIDRFASDKCSGGIRMAHDISLSEVAHLARTMTLKYAFKNSYSGGAKAGIICPLSANAKHREAILVAFGRSLRPLLKTIYGPGCDLGIGPEEKDIITRAAGLRIKRDPARHKGAFFTAYSVFVSAKTIIRNLGLRFNDCTFAVEGYGNVGRPLAKLIRQAGGRILAISTIDGAIFDPSGLDIDKLEALANIYGDKVVQVYNNTDKIQRTDLFTVHVNVLIPGAMAWSINIDNAYEVTANAVVPIANIPVTKEASEVLFRRGITYVPDFVANNGGVIGSNLLNRGYEEDDVLHIIRRTLEMKVSKLMELSHHNNINIEDLAVAIANSNFNRLRDNATARKHRGRWFVTKIEEEKSIIPMLQRAGCRLYEKLHGRNLFLRDIFKPLAIANVYRELLGDVKHYPTLRVAGYNSNMNCEH